MARVRFKQGGTSRAGRVFLILFGLLFAGVGGLVLFFLFVQPALGILAAQSWVATPCVVESSTVEESAGEDGSTYKVAVTYRYEFGGQTYRGERYSFSDVSSSGRAGKQRVVDALPPGAVATCYVNPAVPGEAVIERGWTNDLWFGLIPLLFFVVGLAIVTWGVLQPNAGRAKLTAVGVPARDWLPALRHETRDDRVVLRPQQTPLFKLVFLLIFALFWNGIVSVFVIQIVRGHLAGDPEWLPTIFMVPFVLAGLGLFGAVAYQFMALLNPAFELTLDRAAAAPGGVLRLAWRIDGAVGRLKSVRIELIGEEIARYRRGTDTVTDKHTFHERTVYESPADVPLVNVTGACDVDLPPDAMHSFKSANNAIEWRLRVRGDVPRWPDVSNEYAILVTPGDEPRMDTNAHE